MKSNTVYSTSRVGPVLLSALLTVTLAGCTGEITGYSIDLAKAQCATKGGVGFISVDSTFRDTSLVYCVDGSYFWVKKGAVSK